MYAEYIHVSRYLLICANNPALEGQNHFRNIYLRTQNTSMSLGTCSNAQIIQRWKARIIFRNNCVCAQNTSMFQGTCFLCVQKASLGRSKLLLGISAYLCRIHPCAEMIQIASSLVRIYTQTPNLYLMDFLIHKSKIFNA